MGCVVCEHPFVWGPQDGTLGRVYSEAGRKEVRISGLCETCFDNITDEGNFVEESHWLSLTLADDEYPDWLEDEKLEEWLENHEEALLVPTEPPEIIWNGHHDPTIWQDR